MDEKSKFISFYRIGIREIEIKNDVQKHICDLFCFFIYAILINISYSYYTDSSYGYRAVALLYGIITSFIFLIIH